MVRCIVEANSPDRRSRRWGNHARRCDNGRGGLAAGAVCRWRPSEQSALAARIQDRCRYPGCTNAAIAPAAKWNSSRVGRSCPTLGDGHCRSVAGVVTNPQLSANASGLDSCACKGDILRSGDEGEVRPPRGAVRVVACRWLAAPGTECGGEMAVG